MKKPIEVFSEWALNGKDKGMEKNHANPVEEMLNFITKERNEIGNEFSFLDLGCGNGWVVRKMLNEKLCNKAVGIDGSINMIANAKAFNDNCKYLTGDLEEIELQQKFDVIHSMEVLYYIDKPADLLEKIAKFWLAENGRLIVGIDRYFENQESHSWDTDVGTKMHLKSEYEWVEMFKAAGFKQVSNWRANANDSWAGTLVISAN